MQGFFGYYYLIPIRLRPFLKFIELHLIDVHLIKNQNMLQSTFQKKLKSSYS
jgi:hypothetical protein